MAASRWQVIRLLWAMVREFWALWKEEPRDIREDDVRVWLRNPRDLRKVLRKALLLEFSGFLDITVDHRIPFKDRLLDAGCSINCDPKDDVLRLSPTKSGEVDYKILPFPIYQNGTWEQISKYMLMNKLVPAGIEQAVAYYRKFPNTHYQDPIFAFGSAKFLFEGTVKVPYIQRGGISIVRMSKDAIMNGFCWVLVMPVGDQDNLQEEEGFSVVSE